MVGCIGLVSRVYWLGGLVGGLAAAFLLVSVAFSWVSVAFL